MIADWFLRTYRVAGNATGRERQTSLPKQGVLTGVGRILLETRNAVQRKLEEFGFNITDHLQRVD